MTFYIITIIIHLLRLFYCSILILIFILFSFLLHCTSTVYFFPDASHGRTVFYWIFVANGEPPCMWEKNILFSYFSFSIHNWHGATIFTFFHFFFYITDTVPYNPWWCNDRGNQSFSLRPWHDHRSKQPITAPYSPYSTSIPVSITPSPPWRPNRWRTTS